MRNQYVDQCGGLDGSVEGRQTEALARLAEGEPRAFACVVREHQAMVYSLAVHFLRDAALAEDVAQEVFLQLYENCRAIRSADHLRSWLRKVTVHRALDCLRRKRISVPLENTPEPYSTATVGDPWLEDKLWRLVLTLPEKWRMVVILQYQEDLGYQEIAEVMKIPVNTVKSSLERALAILRKKLEHSTVGVKL